MRHDAQDLATRRDQVRWQVCWPPRSSQLYANRQSLGRIGVGVFRADELMTAAQFKRPRQPDVFYVALCLWLLDAPPVYGTQSESARFRSVFGDPRANTAFRQGLRTGDCCAIFE